MAKLKLRDFKQGKTVYHAFAFPHTDPSKNVAWFDTVNILDRPKPFYSPYFSKPQWGFECTEGGLNNLRERVVWIESLISEEMLTISFHRMFRTPRQAQRYCNRMERGCYTALERKRIAEAEKNFAEAEANRKQARWERRYGTE